MPRFVVATAIALRLGQELKLEPRLGAWPVRENGHRLSLLWQRMPNLHSIENEVQRQCRLA